MTPAAKPGAGAQDHWEGSPSWGNPYGFEWYELAGTETIPGDETTVYATVDVTGSPSSIPDYSHGTPLEDSFGNRIEVSGNTNYDWFVDHGETLSVSSDGTYSEVTARYFVYRISGSTPDITIKIWNVYTYRFLQWMYQRQERRTA